MFAFLSSVVLILKSLVTEKELRIREGMLIMGCPGRAYWASWLATHYFSLVIVSIGMALIGTRAKVMPGCDVGDGAVVGAESMLTKGAQVPAQSIFAGTPAKLIRMRGEKDREDTGLDKHAP